MKYVFVMLLIVCSTVSKAQDGPPPMAMPTENNKVLIDEVIKVTNYEVYFRIIVLRKLTSMQRPIIGRKRKGNK